MKRVWRDIVAVGAITVAVLLPVTVYAVLNAKTNHNARVAYVTQCGTDNDTRRSVTHIVDKLAARSRIAATANQSAPNQTPEQHVATAKSLAIINELQNYARDQLRRKPCSYPPTSSTSSTTTSTTKGAP